MPSAESYPGHLDVISSSPRPLLICFAFRDSSPRKDDLSGVSRIGTVIPNVVHPARVNTPCLRSSPLRHQQIHLKKPFFQQPELRIICCFARGVSLLRPEYACALKFAFSQARFIVTNGASAVATASLQAKGSQVRLL
jgi:hypothetical protein